MRDPRVMRGMGGGLDASLVGVDPEVTALQALWKTHQLLIIICERASLVRPQRAVCKRHASIFPHCCHFLRIGVCCLITGSLNELPFIPSRFPFIGFVASGHCEGLCLRQWWRRADANAWIWLPTSFSHKSDQSLKVESLCTLQQVLLTLLGKPFIKLCIVLPPCPQTLCYILMSIRSVRLTAKGRWRRPGQHYPISGPAIHLKKGREVYTTTVWWVAAQ